MWGTLAQFLTGCVTLLYRAAAAFFAGLEKIFGPVLAKLIPILCPIGYALYWVVTHITARIHSALAVLNGVQVPGTSLTGLGMLSVANTFFPLVETMGLLTAYLAFLVTLTGYRMLKSWIPTLGS